MDKIKTTVEYLDETKDKYSNYSHFTVRNGKAKYHMIFLADRSVGWYYAVRVADRGGYLTAKRALEPLTEITCHGELRK